MMKLYELMKDAPRLSVRFAAEMLKVGPQKIKTMIRSGKYDWGEWEAAEGRQKSAYYIYTIRFINWLYELNLVSNETSEEILCAVLSEARGDKDED